MDRQHRRRRRKKGKRDDEIRGRSGKKRTESESVCECNSLPLLNPREFTDCRGERSEIERYKRRVKERDEREGDGRKKKDESRPSELSS